MEGLLKQGNCITCAVPPLPAVGTAKFGRLVWRGCTADVTAFPTHMAVHVLQVMLAILPLATTFRPAIINQAQTDSDNMVVIHFL